MLLEYHFSFAAGCKVLVSGTAQGVALMFWGGLDAAAQIHDVCWQRGGVATRRAGAAAGNVAPRLAVYAAN